MVCRQQATVTHTQPPMPQQTLDYLARQSHHRLQIHQADCEPLPYRSIIDEKCPAVTIHYCSQCNWLLRAGWMAQELLNTFGDDLASVTLMPGTGGLSNQRRWRDDLGSQN